MVVVRLSYKRCHEFDSRRLASLFTFLYFRLITSKFIYYGFLLELHTFNSNRLFLCALVLHTVFLLHTLVTLHYNHTYNAGGWYGRK